MILLQPRVGMVEDRFAVALERAWMHEASARHRQGMHAEHPAKRRRCEGGHDAQPGLSWLETKPTASILFLQYEIAKRRMTGAIPRIFDVVVIS